MTRKMKATFFGLLSLLTTHAFSATTHILIQGITVPYELLPMTPQVFTNVYMWPIQANCTVMNQGVENPIVATVLRRSGSLNGTNLSQGDSLEIIIKTGDKFQITAEPGSKVELLNRGEKSIKASCTTR